MGSPYILRNYRKGIPKLFAWNIHSRFEGATNTASLITIKILTARPEHLEKTLNLVLHKIQSGRLRRQWSLVAILRRKTPVHNRGKACMTLYY